MTRAVTIPNPDLPADDGAVTRAIENLGTAIGDARLRIEGGEAIDLVGLDERVRTICAAIGRLDGAAARALLPRLVALTDGLDALETVLKRSQPRSVPPRQAAEAYGRLK